MENFKGLNDKDIIIKHIEFVKGFIAYKATLTDPKTIEIMNALIDLHKKMVPDKMQHFEDKMYFGGKDGGLFSDYTKKWSKKKAEQSGYIGDIISTNGKIKNKIRHRLIYECYYGIIEDGFQIDHIDSDPSNNSIFNLQKLTVKEHAKKTHGGKKNKGGLKNSKPVTRFKIDIDGKEIDIVTYNSATEASIAIGCSQSSIVGVLSGRENTIKTYFFKYTEIKEDDKYKNEKWKSLVDVDDKFKECNSEISDFGRVKTENGIISYGSKNPNGYCVVTIKNVAYKVHTLVTLAFHGKKPSGKHSVDHINRKKDDNRKENLRWANSSEQTDNCCAKPVNIYKDGKLVGYYKSFLLAAKSINVHKSSIGMCIRGERTHSGGYTFKLAEKEQTIQP